MGLLGIDIGTSGPKAAVFSERGDQIAVASAEYALFGSSRENQLHPETLWSALRNVVRDATSRASNIPIRAVSISSQGETFVPVDDRGQPVGSFITNVDRPADAEAHSIAAIVGDARIREITGLPTNGMYTLPKIMRLKTAHPELFARSVKFLCIEDYIFSRVGVGAFISHSLASRTCAFDIVKREWSDQILGACGLDSKNFAAPVPSATPLGTAPPDVAEELGLPLNALWVSGGHDQGCCSIGSGGLMKDIAVDGTGTFECLTVSGPIGPQRISEIVPPFPIEAHLDPKQFLTLAYVPGGMVPSWILANILSPLCQKEPEAPLSYDALLQNSSNQPTGVYVFPHLIGTGTPWLNSGARGAILGLTHDTTAQSLFRATLEGVCFEMKWNIEILETLGRSAQTIHAVGGGARSKRWLQLKADIFGRAVVSIHGESSCAGAAMCAGIGLGMFSSWNEASDVFVRPLEAFSPRSSISQNYQSHFDQYKELAGRVFNFHVGAKVPSPTSRSNHD